MKLIIKNGRKKLRSEKLIGKKVRTFNLFTASLCIVLNLVFISETLAQRKMEYLTRGVVAIKSSDNVFLSWRKFATDSNDISFNIYRDGSLITSTPVAGKSNYIDSTGSLNSVYYVEAIHGPDNSEYSTPVSVWENQYLTIPLQTPENYAPNDASVADLDGDGELEIIVKMEGASRDNSQQGITDPLELHAYKLDGTLLWKINLGINIRAGAHYTQFMVYDLDGDGRAEMACKTAPGSKDATGNYLSMGPAAADDDAADYRTGGGWEGFVTSGPEYLTIYDGLSGRELETVLYVPDRNPSNGWGKTSENYNRVDRFLACVAYLDGVNPSLVMCRGYYGRSVLVAWDWNNGSLTQRWIFDSNNGYPTYTGQGSHSISVGDADGDGFDEIMYGAMAIDHDGTPLYNTRFDHGDATHLGDLIPSSPGLEFYMPSESAGSSYDGVLNPGVHVRNAGTGEVIWKIPTGSSDNVRDIGRAMTADITAAYPGNEFWAAGGLGIYNSSGADISGSSPPINFAAWWDGDALREMLDGITVSKWGAGNLLVADGCSSNNSTKSTPALSGDIIGDWREEVMFRTNDNQSLRLYTTTIPTDIDIYTLLHDPQYRLALTWQNVAYNQPPHPSFFIGDGMAAPPKQNIKMIDPSDNPFIKIISPKNGYELPLGLNLNMALQILGIPDTNYIIISEGDNAIDTIKSAPYVVSIPDLLTGSYKLSAKAKDKNGEWINSDSINITVDEGYPFITMTSPLENPLLWPGDSVLISADAFDYDGTIDSVEFYLNGVVNNTIKTHPYQVKVSSSVPNAYKAYGIVYDNNGKYTISDTVSFDYGGSIRIAQENEAGFCGFNMGGGTIDSNHPDYTGTGFINTSNEVNSGVIWAIVFNEPGIYRTTWRYASASDRDAELRINDTVVADVPFKSTGDWTIWDSTSVSVHIKHKGYTEVALLATQGAGLGNVDFLKVVNITASEPTSVGDCSVDDSVKKGYPYIKLVAPLINQVFGSGDSVLILANAFDYDGNVDSVEFYVDNVLTGKFKTGPYKIKVSNPGVGLFKVHAVAYDNSGKNTVSDTVPFIVGSDFLTVQEDVDGFCGFISTGTGSIDNDRSNYTGTGFANSQNIINAEITWAIEFPEPGFYNTLWRYASTSDMAGELKINDSPVTDVAFTSTGNLDTWDTASVNVEIESAGLTKISLRAKQNGGLPNIDFFEVVTYATSQAAANGDCSELVGIKNIVSKTENHITIYPAPASDFINIRMNDAGELINKVSVYKLDGTEMTSNYNAENEVRLELNGLSNGIYVVKIETQNRIYTSKFIVNK